MREYTSLCVRCGREIPEGIELKNNDGSYCSRRCIDIADRAKVKKTKKEQGLTGKRGSNVSTLPASSANPISAAVSQVRLF